MEISRKEMIFVGMSKEDYLKIKQKPSIPIEFESTDPIRLLILNPERHSDEDYVGSARGRAAERYGISIDALHLYRKVVRIEKID